MQRVTTNCGYARKPEDFSKGGENMAAKKAKKKKR
jgi:hypothetical protein